MDVDLLKAWPSVPAGGSEESSVGTCCLIVIMT